MRIALLLWLTLVVAMGQTPAPAGVMVVWSSGGSRGVFAYPAASLTVSTNAANTFTTAGNPTSYLSLPYRRTPPHPAVTNAFGMPATLGVYQGAPQAHYVSPAGGNSYGSASYVYYMIRPN